MRGKKRQLFRHMRNAALGIKDNHKTELNCRGLFWLQPGQATGFSYTDDNKSKGTPWGKDTLMDYLENPKVTSLERELFSLADLVADLKAHP